MKQLLAIVLMAGFVACNQANSTDPTALTVNEGTATDQVGEKNKAIVDKYLNAYLKGDSKGMAELLTDDYKGYGLGVNDVSDKAKTLESVDKHWEKYKYGGKKFNTIESIAMTTTKDGGRGRAAGDWVFLWGDMSTDYPATPDYGDKAVTATFTFHAVYRVNKDGKIDMSSTYFNHEDIMKQLGYKYLSVAEQKKVANVSLDYK